MRERSHRLLEEGDTALGAGSTERLWGGSAALDAFIDDHPLWKEDGAFVALRDPRIAGSVISRLQRAGACFIHAAVVGLHYLRNFSRAPSASAHADVVDITRLMLRTLVDGSLSRYLFADDGGYTEEVIRQLYLPAEGQTEVATLDSGNADSEFVAMRQRLVDYGVGFVTSFNVEPAFMQPGAASYLVRSAEPENEVLHAMLLIGVRFDALRNEHLMLLQNWWEGKEFVEVGQCYWKASKAKLLFVMTPQTALRTGVRTVPHVRAAAGVIGAGVLRPQPTRGGARVTVL